MKVIAIIPAYHEASVIAGVVRKTVSFVDEVVVVDDGSEDRTGETARAAGARVYTHVLNRGLGAALSTGMAAALKRGADVIITLDADGQHDPVEIPNFVRAINEKKVDAVIGSRFLGKTEMPALRRVYNRIGNLLTYLLFGIRTTDSQSGFRAFTRRGAQRLELKTNRMEVSSEFLKEIHDKQISFCEIPCSVKYTDYSMSKGQSFGVGISTAFKLVLRRLM
ncbi:MAG: Glycosyl transferase family 2 [Candidatus Uhrbacteria bacterium GW2011_GWC2_53_7]|uniref:Glycosyl transferase family 2 n=1 Tax=Candidatus Uhrbacteria bacterium GW2011_GWC2_53_7 TaxID=1618986 RepID=A0A0G1Y1L8_9BACT|nr:MAG: Glycosyl transferase family 2 [Parcubacteria group bacterium GW2011_GWA2_53_21]KKW37050.1 MAG: Glycosyl transferase family 2 [Candidatus Uhrbacteria bacterium GW2011_GWC2_53_7]